MTMSWEMAWDIPTPSTEPESEIAMVPVKVRSGSWKTMESAVRVIAGSISN
jgi:hypothetical protein